jgi:hypothetical protein
MSQIDKIIYIPLLFWFIIFIVFIYFFVFSYFLTTFLTIIKIRVLYLKNLNKLFNKNIINISIIFLANNLFNYYNYNFINIKNEK